MPMIHKVPEARPFAGLVLPRYECEDCHEVVEAAKQCPHQITCPRCGGRSRRVVLQHIRQPLPEHYRLVRRRLMTQVPTGATLCGAYMTDRDVPRRDAAAWVKNPKHPDWAWKLCPACLVKAGLS